MLRIDNLRVAYGKIVALKDASLEVNAGEIVGLIGPNGAGKSTTLRAVLGIKKPVSGNIFFENRSLLGQKPETIARRGVALVPEGRRIFARLTVEENLRLGATIRKDRQQVETDIRGIVQRFPILETYFHSSAGKLSGGEQQQLAIGRALLSRPRLLLLDEPSLGLAPKIVDELFETLAELRVDGVTMLLVEQNALRTIELADRTYVLRTGVIQISGGSSELLGHPEFEAMYLGI